MSAIGLHRLAHRLHRRGWCRFATLLRRATYLVYHAVLPPEVEIGPDTVLAYGGLGVVLHPRCRIGAGVFISHEVTIGGRSGLAGLPVVEDGCFLGPGSKILGPIRVGAGAVVGANAVVIHDVPPRAVVGGVPARILREGGPATGGWRPQPPAATTDAPAPPQIRR
jgi:serine O-acetyltransferase